eukprot:776731-Pyramimonas_sp.AAC.1
MPSAAVPRSGLFTPAWAVRSVGDEDTGNVVNAAPIKVPINVPWEVPGQEPVLLTVELVAPKVWRAQILHLPWPTLRLSGVEGG